MSGQPHDLPQAAADAVADDRIADFLGHREADAGRWRRRPPVLALARLKHEIALMLAASLGGGDEIGAFFQARNAKVRTPWPFGVRENFWPSPGRVMAGAPDRRPAAASSGRKALAAARAAGVDEPCGRRRWPCGRGNRDDACARAWRAGRSASRECSGYYWRVAARAWTRTILQRARASLFPPPRRKTTRREAENRERPYKGMGGEKSTRGRQESGKAQEWRRDPSA